jgi:hypothetical protein
MTGPGIKDVSAPPSVAAKRVPRSVPLDTQSKEGRDVIATGAARASGYSGCILTAILPQRQQQIKVLAFARHFTENQIAEVIERQLEVDRIHPDYLEVAPDNWFERRQMTARFKLEWQDLDRLERTTPEIFKAHFDQTIPVFIETDGACAGNP